jgi:hypothetical protein
MFLFQLQFCFRRGDFQPLSKRVSELEPSAAVKAESAHPNHYLTLSKTITPSSNGRYKIEKKNNCRARDTVNCRANWIANQRKISPRTNALVR